MLRCSHCTRRPPSASWTRRAERPFATAFGAALLANRGPAPAPGASFKSLIKGAEDTLAAWKAAGWTKDAKITFEGSADLAEAADDFASGYEVKTSVALGGAASCLADACLEERGIAWHPDPCCLALASYLAQSKTKVSLTAPTPHKFDEFLLDDVAIARRPRSRGRPGVRPAVESLCWGCLLWNRADVEHLQTVFCESVDRPECSDVSRACAALTVRVISLCPRRPAARRRSLDMPRFASSGDKDGGSYL